MNPNYQQQLEFLYSLQYSGIKLGLKNITRLLNELGNPQKHFPAVHLAGTNGKGSTAAFMASVLQEAGYRVGLYTSPHLVDFTERIRINGEAIPREVLIEYVRELRAAIERIRPTFFEATTALALRYFADRRVDVAVVETGLGGRLDATNLVEPVISVITPIGLEHQQYLGETLEAIAGEKAGIIKPGIPVVTSTANSRVMEVFRNRARELDAPLHVLEVEQAIRIHRYGLEGTRFALHTERADFPALTIRLAGKHQVHNAALAVEGLLRAAGLTVPSRAVEQGLARCFWPGRLHVLHRQPLVLLDVSHNPPGFRTTLSFLRELFPRASFKIILGLAKDKDSRSIVDILIGEAKEIALVEWFSERGLPARVLAQAFARHNVSTTLFPDVATAYRTMREHLTSREVLLIIGSHYLAGAFLEQFPEYLYPTRTMGAGIH